MPLDSPALQNYRVGMFYNKTYPSTPKRENAQPRINPWVRDRNHFGEHIDRLIHARNDAIRINQAFNGANSSLVQKMIMLYALFNVLAPENLAGLSLRRLNNCTNPLSPMALSPPGGAINSTSDVTGGLATLAVSQGETLIKTDNATNSGASANNTFAYNARANRPAPTPARRWVKRETRNVERRKQRGFGAETSRARLTRSTSQVNEGKTLPLRIKRAPIVLEHLMGSLLFSALNPLRFPLCDKRAPSNIDTHASAAAPDSAKIGLIAEESRDIRCKDKNGLTTVLESISALGGLAGVMASSAVLPAAMLVDTFILGRKSDAAITPDDIAQKAAEIKKVAVTAAEEIVAEASSIGNIAVSVAEDVAEDVAAGASVIENAAEVAVKEIAMGAAVVQEAAVASAEDIAASAIALGEVATAAAEDILAQATAINDAVAETAVESAMEDIAAPDDRVDVKSNATAQAAVEMYDTDDAAK